VTKLFELWSIIGIKAFKEIDDRKKAVASHVSGIFDRMVIEEEQTLDNLTKAIQRQERDRRELRKDLGYRHDSTDDDEDQLTLIEIDKKLRTQVGDLKEKKAERMKVYNDAKNAEADLCEATGMNTCPIELDRMPTEAQVHDVHKHISHLKVR
jgi:hypothetical protein